MDLERWASRRDALIARELALEAGLTPAQIKYRLKSLRYRNRDAASMRSTALPRHGTKRSVP